MSYPATETERLIYVRFPSQTGEHGVAFPIGSSDPQIGDMIEKKLETAQVLRGIVKKRYWEIDSDSRAFLHVEVEEQR